MSNVYRRFTGGRQSAVAPLLALVVVAMLWGGSFVVVKSAVAEIPPATLVAWRFTIATVVVLLGKPRCLCGVRARSALRAVALGALFGAGFLLQSWGMQSTRAVFSAFIAGSAVVMVPVIAWLWFNRRMNASTGWAVALTTVGLALISWQGSTFGAGELLTLAAAALWAVHLVALERWSRSSEVVAMAVIQLAVVAGLAWFVHALLPGDSEIPSSPSAWSAVIVLGVLGTAVPLVLLTYAQAKVNATTSAVVLTLEPVFGAVAAITVGGEAWSGLLLIGAVAVVMAAVIASHGVDVVAGPLVITDEGGPGDQPVAVDRTTTQSDGPVIEKGPLQDGYNFELPLVELEHLYCAGLEAQQPAGFPFETASGLAGMLQPGD